MSGFEGLNEGDVSRLEWLPDPTILCLPTFCNPKSIRREGRRSEGAKRPSPCRPALSGCKKPMIRLSPEARIALISQSRNRAAVSVGG